MKKTPIFLKEKMSLSSVTSEIKNKGTVIAPKYFYISSGEEYPMGTNEMYRVFIANFSDNNTATAIFNNEKGMKIIETMLTVLKCPLYIPSIDSPEYLQNISQAFDIIKLYFSNISNIGKERKIYESYSNMIPNIVKKSTSSNVKNTPLSRILMDISTSLTSSNKNVIRDVSQIISKQGTVESARAKLLSLANVGSFSDLFLSPINPSIFTELREYCSKAIGEGTKVSEDEGHNIENMKRSLLSVLGYFRNDVKMTEQYENHQREIKPSLNSNSIENVNKFLICFLQNPSLMHDLFKITDCLSKINSEYDEDISYLKTIFLENYSFDYFLFDGSYSRYIGGSKSGVSSISRIPYSFEMGENSKLTNTKSSITSFQDDTSSDEEMIISKKRSKKVKPTKTKIFGEREDGIKIDIKAIKSLMKLISESIDPFVSEKSKNKAKENFSKIIKGTFGNLKDSLELDWWQSLFLSKVSNKESFILVGDTSGGKTFISLMALRTLFTKYISDSSSKIIYLAPTSQLTILQFSNMLTAYPSYSHYFGICCKSIVDIPSTTKILFGTPCMIKRFLYQYSFPRDTPITGDSISDEIIKSLATPFINNCRNLFIDEVQTLSPTYVQNQEIEKIMECKGIEEVIRTVSFSKNRDSQVVALSATLSPSSIENLKNKISELTGIPSLSEIIYGHDDIGLKNLEDKSSFTPIMKKPLIIPIKVNNLSIESFKRDDEITYRLLDNEVIEMIVRDAMTRRVVPFTFYRESELTAIQAYKSYISYLEMKNLECEIWHSLASRYNNDLDSLGNTKMNEISQKEKWLNIILEEINRIKHTITSKTIVHRGDFDKLLSNFKNSSSIDLELEIPVLSPELYGLLVEYCNIKTGQNAFVGDIHPYYRFGSRMNNSFFSLVNSATGEDTIFKKILVAQDSDPTSNVGSIIPTIIRGIAFGVGLITSSTPLGYQLKIFEYINIKTKQSDGSFPIPIIFSNYDMSMGVNFSTMGVCILRFLLSTINASEFKQILGRPGRRGNSSDVTPVMYTYNVSNIFQLNMLEDLNFDVSSISSSFFNPNEIYDFLCKLIVKYENNRTTISDKIETNSENIISGDCFKDLGNSDVLLVRKIQLANYQIRELFDTCKNMFPKISDDVLRSIFLFLQKAEFYNLNVQIA